jgi:hypothetical protein
MLKQPLIQIILILMILFLTTCDDVNKNNSDQVLILTLKPQPSADFRTMVTQAQDYAGKFFPGIELFEVDGIVPDGSGQSAQDVTMWRFVFWNVHNTTVILYCVDGSFTKLRLLPEPWLEDEFITLPLQRGLSEAIEILHGAGYTDPFSYVTLRKPLYPGIDEASYIFTIPAIGQYVFVGVDTGDISTE